MQTGETRFEELKRYIGFSGEDARLLRAARDLVRPHFERIAREFYDRIRMHEEAHAVFTGEAQIARLHLSLVRWLDRLFCGVYDEAFARETAQIGRVHVKVGLPQRYMFTAMARIRSALIDIVESAADCAPGTVGAISRLLDLELAVMLETYRDDFVARIQHIERLEREALGRSLARTEHRYVSAVELARVLILGLDADGCVRLFNREAERVSGFARDEALGRPFVELLSVDETGDGARLRERLARFAADHRAGRNPTQPQPGDDAPPLETTIHTRAGSARVIRWHLTYAPAEGDDVAVFAIGIDSTDESARLARLQQQEKLAAIGTLAAGLAHEIRNPLNGAQLHLTFLERALRRGDSGPQLLDAVTVVGDEMKRLGALVSDFLDFARPRPLSLETVSLQPLFERVLQLVDAQARAAGVALALDLPTTSIELDADPAKLEQVLLNLVQNGIEALAGRRGHVVLRARRQPRFVVLEVEDDGPGVPEGSPIFDAFFSSKPRGTGLGLSIAHRIVTDHGGSIDVDSRPGCSIFRVTLPLFSSILPANRR